MSPLAALFNSKTSNYVNLCLSITGNVGSLERICLMHLSHVMRKTRLMPFANNKDADQPAHPRSLISAFGVRSLDSIIFIDVMLKISRL